VLGSSTRSDSKLNLSFDFVHRSLIFSKWLIKRLFRGENFQNELNAVVVVPKSLEGIYGLGQSLDLLILRFSNLDTVEIETALDR